MASDSHCSGGNGKAELFPICLSFLGLMDMPPSPAELGAALRLTVGIGEG